MTVSSDVVQDLMVAAILGKTGAAANVFAPRDWPTTADEMPIILVQSPTEVKENVTGRTGAPQFHVTTTIRVIGRVFARAQTGDRGALAALAATALLQRQIEVAAINDYALRRVIQQYASVKVTNDVKRDGENHFGELVMDFAIEFYQGPEDFAPNPANALSEMAIFADLVNVISTQGDATGSPLATPFVAGATPAPRTAGPDGQAEGAVIWDFPSDLGGLLDFSDPNQSGLLPPTV